MKNKIADIQTLQFEKQRLQEACKTKEIEINKSFNYVQDNVGSIFMKSIFLKSNSAKDKFDFVQEVVATSFDAIVNIATDKENRTEHIKELGKKIVSTLISKAIK